MALITEDGTGKADAEVYDTVANCAAYLTKRNLTVFDALATTALKEAHLLRGTQYVEWQTYRRLVGRRKTSTQALNWPRAWATTPEGFGIDASTIPAEYKHATFEAAELSAAGEALLDFEDDTIGNVKRDKVGPLETEYFSPGSAAAHHYQVVEALIGRFLTPLGRLVRA